MQREQDQVRFFHTKHGFTRHSTPTAPDAKLADERNRIMEQEFLELKMAMVEGDLVKIADGAADSIYTILGTMVACGIELDPIFQEVHRSNMTKDRMDPVTKKGGKGPSFEPARVAECLLLQTPSYLDLSRAMATHAVAVKPCDHFVESDTDSHCCQSCGWSLLSHGTKVNS